MSLNIKNPEAHRLAREVADRTGETLTEAVTEALRRRLAALEERSPDPGVLSATEDVRRLLASLPDLDTRPAEEILGYDDTGLPA
ncbi:MAG TPA: type II toxin-antitoxin system VapB family antitoxin [Longimicrobiales bacterium]|nr:type II toxin-antitoxin system VapB family antitoxin [Longimicrobiales bacterium]